MKDILYQIFKDIVLIYLKPIVEYSSFGNPFFENDVLKKENDRFLNPDYAAFMELLVHDGYDEFYRGEIARDIVVQCETRGGFLTMKDFEEYEVALRKPLSTNYRDYQILTNPPPSSGGTLMAFCTGIIESSKKSIKGILVLDTIWSRWLTCFH